MSETADDSRADAPGSVCEAGVGRPRRRLRARLAGVAKWALVALALLLAARLIGGIGWQDLAARLGAARWTLLGLALAALLLRYAVWAWRWRLAVRRVSAPPPLGRLFLMVVAAAAVNHLTPGARVLGGVLRGRHLARADGGSVGRAYGSVLYDQIAHQAAVAGVGALAVIAAATAVGRYRTAALIAGAVAAAAVGVALWLRRRAGAGGQGIQGGGDAAGESGTSSDRTRGRLARFLAERAASGGRARRLFAHGREAVDTVARLLGDRRLALDAAALGFALSLLYGLALWTVFAALGAGPNFFVVLAVVAVGTVAGAALGTPGGAGTTEAAMIATFTVVGVDRLDATAATLLFRGLHYLSLLTVGSAALVVLESGLGGRRAQAAAAARPVPVAAPADP